MPQPPRKHQTHIEITSDGRWLNDGVLIENKEILLFFKSNLHRDKTGIYIYNTMGGFSEKGYLNVNGPLMKVELVEKKHYLLENGEKIDTADSTLVVDKHDHLYLLIPHLGGWAVFSRQAKADLGEMLEYESGYRWNNIPINKTESIEWIIKQG